MTYQRFDQGLQPERTALASRRTSLNIAAGGLVAMQLLPEVIGLWGIVLGVAGVIAGLGLARAALRRERRESAVLVTGSGLLPDGSMLLVLAVAATGVGVVSIGAPALWAM